MKKMQMGALSGILFPILSIVLFGISTKYIDVTTPDPAYLAALTENFRTIQIGSGLGLLSVVLLLIHLEWLTGVVSKHAPLSAKVARSCGQIAAIGFALTFTVTMLVAFGAGEDNWPDQIVRTIGLLGVNIGWVTTVGLGAFAGVIAYLGWNGKFPKWIATLATLEVVIAVVATAVGAPGAAFMPTMIWLIINAVGLLFHERKSS